MTSLRSFGISLTIGALMLAVGCDFHEEPPPLEGEYEPTRFDIAFGDSTVDVLSAGGWVALRFQRTNSQRRVEAELLVPEQTIFPNQERIDTTMTGTYFRIVDRVELQFGEGSTMLPTRWTYENGALRSQGFLQIELGRR